MAGQLTQADQDAIGRSGKAFLTALAGDDVAGMLTLLTSDGQVFPPHEAPLVGVDANRAWHEARVAQYKSQLATSDNEIIGDGAVAFERFAYTLTLTPKAGGNTIEDRGNCIWLWRRQGDGSWKVARAMWNSPQPMPAA